MCTLGGAVNSTTSFKVNFGDDNFSNCFPALP